VVWLMRLVEPKRLVPVAHFSIRPRPRTTFLFPPKHLKKCVWLAVGLHFASMAVMSAIISRIWMIGPRPMRRDPHPARPEGHPRVAQDEPSSAHGPGLIGRI